jgi:hypothetical protein
MTDMSFNHVQKRITAKVKGLFKADEYNTDKLSKQLKYFSVITKDTKYYDCLIMMECLAFYSIKQSDLNNDIQ